MKKFYYNLFLALMVCVSSVQAQVSITCGDAGSALTVNSLSLSLYGRSGCTIDYDFTLTGTEIGEYKVKIGNLVVVTLPVTSPGILNFSGTTSTALPCFLISDIFGEIRIITPSGATCILDISSLLPVTLTYFTASEDDGKAVLRWATATELNNEGFFIEHARDGENWQPLGFVAGVGTTNEPQNYDFTVDDLPLGDHYFRLKQVDHDGSSSLSIVANLYMEGPDGPLRIFPNPVQRGQQLNIKGGFDQIEVYSLTGQRVLRIQKADDLSLPQFTDLPSGMYQLRIQRHGKTISEKLIVQ
ncbi:MAG: T9SS type A sorting domain-containing protein [Saprospiraceae bacterium]|nr:T9SS type A sorting domain-containing protein [Lewinella sp.]